MNPINTAHDMSNNLADSAAASADSAIRSTQRLANQALDGVAGSVSDVVPMIRAASDQVSALAQRSVDTVRQSSQQLVDSANQASARTRDYVQNEPVKSLLMAAATGAALMALLSMVQRSRSQN